MRIMRANRSKQRDFVGVYLVAAILLAAPGMAGEVEPSGATADSSLVVGDSYTIRAERHGAKQQFKGELVKANDRWIVLRHITPRRRGWSIPVLAQLPVIG